MDDRREPRLQIYAAAKLTLLDSERELECVLLDISSTGVKFVSDEMLPADEVVALDVEDHLVLADVRYSEPRGEKFTIGAERIHSVDKAALPEGKTRAGQIRFLVDDYRGRIRLAIAGEAAAGKKQEGELPIPELPIAHRDQLVEAAAKRMVEQWAKESEAAGTEDALRAAIVDRVVRPVTPPTPVNQLPVSVKRGRPVWGLPFVTASAIAMMIFSGSLFWSYRHSVAANAPHAEVIANVPVKSDVPVPIAVSRTRRLRTAKRRFKSSSPKMRRGRSISPKKRWCALATRAGSRSQ
jgi:hypothetical protein